VPVVRLGKPGMMKSSFRIGIDSILLLEYEDSTEYTVFQEGIAITSGSWTRRSLPPEVWKKEEKAVNHREGRRYSSTFLPLPQSSSEVSTSSLYACNEKYIYFLSRIPYYSRSLFLVSVKDPVDGNESMFKSYYRVRLREGNREGKGPLSLFKPVLFE